MAMSNQSILAGWDAYFLLRLAMGLLVSSVLAFRGFSHKSLSLSGALAGFLVMAISISAGIRFGALIVVFYMSSSMLTKYKSEEKKIVEDGFKEGGQRDWVQVFANSLAATLLSLLVAYITGGRDQCLNKQENPLVTGLLGAILGYYACCNGDTWSSELGVLSKSQPRLITTMQPVPRGTNGGVTTLGLLAAFAAGGLIGLVFFIVGLFSTTCHGSIWSYQILVIPLGCFMGVLGSLIDSFLGAIFQFSGMCAVRKKVVGKPGPTVKRISGENILSNDAVNFFSAIVTSLLTAAITLHIF